MLKVQTKSLRCIGYWRVKDRELKIIWILDVYGKLCKTCFLGVLQNNFQ